MRPYLIIFSSPLRYQYFCLSKRGKYLATKQFIPELTVVTKLCILMELWRTSPYRAKKQGGEGIPASKGFDSAVLTFARGGAPVKVTASITRLLEESATFALRGSNVNVAFSLPNDLWLVEIDEGQMSQVITNLVLNADEAMPEGGLLEMRGKININTPIRRSIVSTLLLLPLEKSQGVFVNPPPSFFPGLRLSH